MKKIIKIDGKIMVVRLSQAAINKERALNQRVLDELNEEMAFYGKEVVPLKKVLIGLFLIGWFFRFFFFLVALPKRTIVDGKRKKKKERKRKRKRKRRNYFIDEDGYLREYVLILFFLLFPPILYFIATWIVA